MNIFLFLLIGTVVNYSASIVEVDFDNKVVVLIGNAKAEREGVEITADTIKYFWDEKVISACGRPVLRSGGGRIVGDSMVFSTETEKGVVYNGRARVEKGWVMGKEIWKVGEDVLKIRDGTFTTCEYNPPHYWFYSPKMVVILDKIVVAEPVFFYVDFVPFLGVPYWLFPIGDERRSGFLVPKVGRNSEMGMYIRDFGYYIVIADNMDGTLETDVTELGGMSGGGEFRYTWGEVASGNLDGSIYYEDGRYDWRINANHSTAIGTWFSCNGKMDIATSNVWNALEDSVFIIQERRYSYAYVSLKHKWGGIGLKVDYDISYSDTMLSSGVATLPLIDMTPAPLNIFGLSWNTGFSVGRKISSAMEKVGGKGGFSTRWTTRLFRFFPLSFPVNVSFVGWRTGIAGDLSWQAQLSTALYGRSVFSIGGVQYFSHVIRPTISFSTVYAFGRGQLDDTTALFAPPDTGSAPKSLTLSVSQEWGAKVGKEKVSFASMNVSWELPVDSVGILGDVVRYVYYRYVTHSHFPMDVPVKPMSMNFLLSPPSEMLKVSLNGTWDIIDAQWQSLTADAKVDLQWKTKAGTQILSASYYTDLLADSLVSNVKVNGHFRPTKKWGISIGTVVDLMSGELIDQSVSVTRDLHCWVAQFSWRQVGSIWKYEFEARIKALPDIKVSEDVFRELLGW